MVPVSVVRARLRYLRNQHGFQAQPVRTVQRLLTWEMRRRMASHATVPLPAFNAEITVPALPRGVARLIYLWRDQYEAELAWLHRALRPGDTFIDVGSCFGIYAIAAATAVGESGAVLAIEPAADTFAELQRNVAEWPQVHAVRCAIGDHDGEAHLADHPLDPGRRFLADEGETVPLRTIDSLVAEHSLASVAAIKIDTEGAELSALQGAMNTIQRDRPRIMFEALSNPAHPTEARRAVFDCLRAAGYDFRVVIDGELHRPQSDRKHDNIIAVPQR